MQKFIKALSMKSIPEGSGTSIDIEGKSLAVFNISGQFYAMDNTCAHRGGPLGEGSLEGQEVTCPWHGWQYNVVTGACSTNPAAGQKIYKTKVEGDDVLIEIDTD